MKKLNPETSCCFWSFDASSVSSSELFLDPLECSHHRLFQGFLCRLFEDMETWVKIRWWSTCVLTIHCLLLLVLMFCTFLCDYFFCVASLSLSLWTQISAGMLLIFFQLMKCLWGRREHEVWSMSFEHKLHAASNFTVQFMVIPIVHGSVKELLILFSKSRKNGFLKIPRKLKQREGGCYQNHRTDEKTSDCYLLAAKCTKSVSQTPANTWYSLKGQSRLMVQSLWKCSPDFV